MSTELPLSALLSKALVACTIECDNEFERRFIEAGHGEQLSVIAWSGFLRHLPEGGATMGDLVGTAALPQNAGTSMAACLERWGFLTIKLKPGAGPRPVLTDGWGSGRGVTKASLIEPTAKGNRATRIFPDVLVEVEGRWSARFSGLAEVRSMLVDLGADERELLVPQLHGALTALAAAYDLEATVPLSLAANGLRVLTDDGVRAGDMPGLTGLSAQCAPQQVTILTRFGLASVGSDPSRRGKVVRLTDAGREGQDDYARISAAIEVGIAAASTARRGLEQVFTADDGEAIRQALTPPAGIRRSGAAAPALGRFDVAAAAKTRNRELVRQTDAFVANPLGALPEFPMWDPNRGFGP